MKNILILAAGKQKPDFTTFSGYNDYGMYPIRGKPSILWVVDTVNFNKNDNIIFAIDSSNTFLKALLESNPKTKGCKITEIDGNLSKGGILETIKLGLSECNLDIKTQILLGDTLILDSITYNFDTILTSKKYQDSRRWCLAEKDDNGFITKYFDKVPNLEVENKEAVVGLYNIKDTHLFYKSVINAIINNNKEISDVLTNYQKERPLSAIKVDKWYDLSSPYAIANAGHNLFNARHFNQIIVDQNGILTKISTNKQKLKQEEKWYKSLPKDLQIFTPRVIDAIEDDQQFHLSIEMYGYQTLSEVFVYGNKNTEDWRFIINRLFNAYNLFSKHNVQRDKSYITSIYKTKTLDRLKKIKYNEDFYTLLNKEVITINGITYKNYNLIEEEILLMVDQIINSCDQDFSIIHGDFCLSNILFDAMNYCFKFIDPRGDVIYGDPRYDIAKLRHSIVGLYDFIVLDMFKLDQVSDDNFILDIFFKDNHIKIGYHFDNIIEQKHSLFEIKFIEALLFLTMIPLHSDFPRKQLAFYLIAIKKFNELFYDK